ncbi:Mur ligase family protein [Arenimonas oryziterrae]|nr:Mur ligase family protein [Arenimonas oryziterrae]
MRVRAMMAALGWPLRDFAVHLHRSGASLAFVAPEDQLLTATEINEWAWQGVAVNTAQFPWPQAPGYPAVWDEEAAVRTLRLMARGEANAAAIALMQAAKAHELPAFFDDDGLTLGAGEGGLTWPNDALPAEVPWRELHDIPTVLVTGSNGKTTTVRLLAAMFRKAGKRSGFNCTDGVFVGGECVESGDYSGPNGARRVLRDARVQAAVLETARGGILRRGLAVHRADAAIVTNISPDHFGEYGVHDLSDLADAKLVLARAIGEDGVLVLNADDALLLEKSAKLTCPLAWFSLDDNHPHLVAHRRHGGATCGVADGVLTLEIRGIRYRLGPVDAMPLTLSGSARYNIANIAGAALVAACLGLSAEVIAAVLAGFGASREDNPGRLERWRIGDVSVLLDYAHNPEGLSGLLTVARSVGASTGGRLGLLLGQAGNRDDGAIRELARTAAAAGPDFVVLKDLDGYMRGRAIGEVPGILRDELLRHGLPETNLRTILPEVEAAQAMLAWARAGDVVVLPVHNLAARAQVVTWLDAQVVDTR